MNVRGRIKPVTVLVRDQELRSQTVGSVLGQHEVSMHENSFCVFECLYYRRTPKHEWWRIYDALGLAEDYCNQHTSKSRRGVHIIIVLDTFTSLYTYLYPGSLQKTFEGNCIVKLEGFESGARRKTPVCNITIIDAQDQSPFDEQPSCIFNLKG